MTMYQPQSNDDMRKAVVNVIHDHWVLFLVEGIILVLLGAAAIIVPVIATLAFTLLIGWSISGAVSLTLVLIAFFVVEGIATLMYAFEHRAQLSRRWGWMLASGIVDLILAGIIFAGL